MQFGLHGPIFPPAERMSPDEAFAFQSKYFETAHRHGFDIVTVGNHFLEGPVVRLMQPLLTAASAMARFPGLYVLTNVYILPYHNPVKVAHELATLDAMSPGALLFGVGQGYREKEGQAFGVTKESRAARLAEGIAAVKLLLKDPHATFKGEFYEFEDADIGLRPSNGEGPPFLVAADKTRTVARIPSIGGDHWLPSPRHSLTFLTEAVEVYKRALDEAGRPFRGIPLPREVAIGATDAEAEAAIRGSYEGIMGIQTKWGQPGERYDLSFEDLKSDRILIGTAAKIAERVIELHHSLGVESLIFRVQTMGMAPERALEMVERLGEEVLPVVRRELGEEGLFPNLRAKVVDGRHG